MNKKCEGIYHMEKYSADMIANLNNLPPMPPLAQGVKLKKAFVGDKAAILSFVRLNFSLRWAYEVEKALLQEKCFIATRNGKLLGFACYDATAKGFFGPTGVLASERGKNIGAALLLRTLGAMSDFGYGYAIIGWVNGAEKFYRKLVNAEYIKGGEPESSIYSNMISQK